MATKTVKPRKTVVRRTKPTVVRNPVVEEEVMVMQETIERPSVNYRLIGLLIILAAVLAVFWYRTNTWPVAAFVNGKPVMRFELDQQLYKQGGPQVLDNLITEKLVADELSKNKMTASVEEVEARINEIKTSLGTSFDAALAAQGMTMDQLKTQIGTQIKVEKLLGGQASISATEVEEMMKQNEIDATAATKMLKQQKLQTIIQDWVEGLRTKAKIKIVGASKTPAVPQTAL